MGKLRESLQQGHRKLVKAIAANIVIRVIMLKVQYILRSYDVVLTLYVYLQSTLQTAVYILLFF
jgi:hypothetical protein